MQINEEKKPLAKSMVVVVALETTDNPAKYRQILVTAENENSDIEIKFYVIDNKCPRIGDILDITIENIC